MNDVLEAKEVIAELQKKADPVRAKHSISFFKTGKGQYAEGDTFLGVTVPDQRKIAKNYKELPLREIDTLLTSPIHEHRLTALFILVLQYEKHPENRERIFDYYLKKTKYVNNWDLVDSSAHKIVGRHLFEVINDWELLKKLAESNSLWEKRIAIIATAWFTKEGQFMPTITIAEILLNDSHDLIHKAVGWMLREVGKHNQKTLESFLDTYAHKMPRTMLRYAIERFSEKKRKYYLAKG